MKGPTSKQERVMHYNNICPLMPRTRRPGAHGNQSHLCGSAGSKC